MFARQITWFSVVLTLFCLVFNAQTLCAAYAVEVSTIIGRSVQGRNITAYKFGTGQHKVIFIGGLHTGAGGEDCTRDMAEQVLAHFRAKPNEIPAEVSLIIIPAVNPDGIELRSHDNARGVDLNRNWPTANWASDTNSSGGVFKAGCGGTAPLSEPETLSLWNFIIKEQPKMVAVWHAKASLVEANEAGIAPKLGELYATTAGYNYLEEWVSYSITGQLMDATEEKLGIPEFDIELLDYACADEEVERNIAAVNAVMREFVTQQSTSSAASKPANRSSLEIIALIVFAIIIVTGWM